MKRRSLAAALGYAVLAAAPAAAAAANVVGSAGQASDQGVNSTQKGHNAVSAPKQTTLGASKNKFGQNSTNAVVDAQAIGVGSPTGDQLIATPGGPGFTQDSTQGVNSGQSGGRIQNSTNLLANIQIVGDGFFVPGAIIGDVRQTNSQAANSSQVGASSGKRIQNSTNALINVQVISATVIIGAANQANSQAVNSTQTIPSGKKQTGTDIVGTGLPIVNQPGFIIGTPTGPVTQNSTDATINAQLIFG